jgi:hypothetical protein
MTTSTRVRYFNMFAALLRSKWLHDCGFRLSVVFHGLRAPTVQIMTEVYDFECF